MASYIRTALFVVAVMLLGSLAKLAFDGRLTLGTATPPTTARVVPAPRKRPANSRPKPVVKKPPEPQPEPEPELPPPTPTGNPFVSTASGGALTAEQATSRIAAEMFDALEDRPVVMIWLFDRTPSAEKLRTTAARRLQEVYRTLSDYRQREHASLKDKPDQLLTVVGAFAKRLDYLTPEPTANDAQVIAALGQLAEDAGNEEMTFAAIREAINKYLSFKTAQGRRLIIGVVTDEIGDDAELVDDTVLLARRHSIPIFVVGMPAPLGRNDSLSTVATVENWKGVRQGPESRDREMINLEFPTVTRDADLFDSGFGPFALSWLCGDSGGAFLAVRELDAAGNLPTSNNTIVQFAPTVMARYAPDYVTAAGYEAILDNKACRALHDAAQLPRIEVATELKLEFRKTDESGLKRDLDKAQQTAARLEPKLRNLWQTLAAGESDRPNVSNPRWQAEYDLAIGRALAARARIEGYNSMLAQLKQGRNFPDPKHTTWVLQPAESFKGESTLEKMGKQAKGYMDRVIKEHPGTPWSLFASRELTAPLGWDWVSK